jgi:hypothetical protein
MDIRTQSVLFRAINRWSLGPFYNGGFKSPVVVFFVKANEITANMVGVVAFQACCYSNVPDNSMAFRLFSAPVRIGYVAC